MRYYLQTNGVLHVKKAKRILVKTMATLEKNVPASAQLERRGLTARILIWITQVKTKRCYMIIDHIIELKCRLNSFFERRKVFLS